MSFTALPLISYILKPERFAHWKYQKVLADLPFWANFLFGKPAEAATFLFCCETPRQSGLVSNCATSKQIRISFGAMELTFLVGQDGQNVKRPRRACTPCRQRKVWPNTIRPRGSGDKQYTNISS